MPYRVEMYVLVAAADPAPDLLTLDKLISIAEHNAIEPVMVVTKTDRSAESASRLADIYRLAGYPVFPVDSLTGEGVDAVRQWINDRLGNRIAAFSGASGSFAAGAQVCPAAEHTGADPFPRIS